MTCSGTSTFSSEYQDCLCGRNARIVENVNSTDGSAIKVCEACAANANQTDGDRPVYSCNVCPLEGQDNTKACICQANSYTLARDRCLPNSEIVSVEGFRAINYDSVESIGNILGPASIAQSDTFTFLFQDAATGCQKYGDPKKC